MVPDSPLIEACGLYRDYGATRAVAGVDLRLDRGEILGLLGPNGAGKTSTMDIVCGVVAPTAGAVAIDGIDLLESPRAAKRALGYLPEQPPLYPEMTVDEYLGFAAALRGVGRGDRAPARRRAVERCGLDGTGHRLVGNLSRGYQQRVGIAQAILHEPAAVVLDEPTVGLDPIQIREIRAVIAALGREHGIVLSTHILPEVQALCPRVTIMHAGRIVHAEALDSTDPGAVERVTVDLRCPPADADLGALAGVTAVERLDGNRRRLHLDPAAGDPTAVADAVVAAGWGLAELTPERRSLEQPFVEVATHDGPAAERVA